MEALRARNDIHNELYEGEEVNVAVDDAITAAVIIFILVEYYMSSMSSGQMHWISLHQW